MMVWKPQLLTPSDMSGLQQWAIGIQTMRSQNGLDHQNFAHCEHLHVHEACVSYRLLQLLILFNMFYRLLLTFTKGNKFYALKTIEQMVTQYLSETSIHKGSLELEFISNRRCFTLLPSMRPHRPSTPGELFPHNQKI